MRARKNNSRKVTVVLLSIILVLCCTIGGTLAWLQMSTDPVTNTFTPSDVTIELTETAPEDRANIKMVPGAEVTKNPTVTVKAGSEACWVFVKIVEKNNTTFNTTVGEESVSYKYLTWTADSKWRELSTSTSTDGTTTTYVYYIDQADLSGTGAKDATYGVLTGNKVTYSQHLTNANMDAAANKPTLEFTAYAIQKQGFSTAELAWAELNK